jgi:hypothetical protein
MEIVTVGSNPNLQLIGSDPAGGGYDLGLWIGPQVTPPLRQTFMLALKSFNAGQRGRLVGFRQYLTMGVYESSPNGAHYPLERPVETATWKFVDGNVLWGIRMIPPVTHLRPNSSNGGGLMFEYSQTPAQLFEAVTPQVVPPYAGTFPGNVLTPDLGRMFELRCRRWSEPVAVDVPFEGPCDIAFLASVLQTTPGSRTPPPTTTPAFLTTQGAVPEDAFLQNYPGSTYFRIAGALIFEMEEQAPTGAPKTYRRPGDADRLTRDTTEVGDNTMRRSAEDTSEYKGCEPGEPGEQRPPKRPQSPPHPNSSLGRSVEELEKMAIGFAGLPKNSSNGDDGVVNRIIRKWRIGFGDNSTRSEKLAEKLHVGVGKLPKDVAVVMDPQSSKTINYIIERYRHRRNGGVS